MRFIGESYIDCFCHRVYLVMVYLSNSQLRVFMNNKIIKCVDFIDSAGSGMAELNASLAVSDQDAYLFAAR